MDLARTKWIQVSERIMFLHVALTFHISVRLVQHMCIGFWVPLNFLFPFSWCARVKTDGLNELSCSIFRNLLLCDLLNFSLNPHDWKSLKVKALVLLPWTLSTGINQSHLFCSTIRFCCHKLWNWHWGFSDLYFPILDYFVGRWCGHTSTDFRGFQGGKITSPFRLTGNCICGVYSFR